MSPYNQKNLREPTLHIAVIAAVIAAALGGSCVFDTKTNLCEATGRICRPGLVCAADQAVCIPVDGCGDGVVGTGEECDDGNIINGDGCNADCTVTDCGNRITESPGEECDAGGDVKGCDSDCTFSECGDGHLNLPAGEDCDTSGMDTADCNGGRCTLPACGDGYLNQFFTPPGGQGAPETCDTGGDSPVCNGNSNPTGLGNCQPPMCGDSYWNPLYKPPGDKSAPEACDTGVNTQLCNGNDSMDGLGNCQIAKCGDGYLNTAHVPPGNGTIAEICDTAGDSQTCNGNSNEVSNGPGNCQPPRCGDGYTNPKYIPPNGNGKDGEQCDQSSMNSDTTPNRCRTNCLNPTCGDGVLDNLYGEVCDKGGAGKPAVGCGGAQNCNNDCTSCI